MLDSAKSIVILETWTPFKIFAPRKRDKKHDPKDCFQRVYNFIFALLELLSVYHKKSDSTLDLN
jgi:hypothetical protein